MLEQSLHSAAMIELGMEEKLDAVEYPWDMVLQSDREDRTLPPSTRIIDIFDAMGKNLLILGEPGSGKTTMLLELARDTIARAEKDPAQPIPVVLNLSSWAEKGQPVTKWLEDELDARYSVPKNVARPWIENDDLLLLLDGLDEVKSELREACAKAINDFRHEHGLAPLVVCSRVADYEALTIRLKLQGAVLVHPLTLEQVDKYLVGVGVELLAVRRALQDDPALQELAQSPLMLSVMTLAYQGMSIEDLQSLSSTETRRRYVFDAYVQRMFKRRGQSERYRPEQAIRWLGWLAHEMLQHYQAVFSIGQMQPSWLPMYTQQRVSVSGLAGGVIGLFIGQIVWTVVAGSGLVGSLVSGLIGGLVFGLFFSSPLVEDEIQLVRHYRWSYSEIRAELKNQRDCLLAFLYLSCLEIGAQLKNQLVGVVAGGAAGGAACAISVGVPLLLLGVVGQGVTPPYIVRLSELIFSTFFCLGAVWTADHSEVSGRPIMVTCTRPLSGEVARRSVCRALTGGVISGLVMGLLGLVVWIGGSASVGEYWPHTMLDLLVGVLIGALYGALQEGGFACLKYLVLRIMLWLKGCVPWSYAGFLDYAAERLFLRKVGGGYIFIHRLLLDYFASLYQSE